MTIPEFKPSERFLDDLKLPCLMAQVKNSKLGVASQCIRVHANDPECQIFLRGKDPLRISPWQHGILEFLFDNERLPGAIDEAINEYLSRGDEVQRRKVKKQDFSQSLTIRSVAVDEIVGEALIYCRPDFDLHLDEHGLTIVLKEGRWRAADGDYYVRYCGGVDEEAASRWKRFGNRLFKWLNSNRRNSSET